MLPPDPASQSVIPFWVGFTSPFHPLGKGLIDVQGYCDA